MTGQDARGDEYAADAARAAHERRLRLNRSVRDARDVLTSTNGLRPALDHELLRVYAEHRIAASLPLFLLIALIGISSSLWTGGYAAMVWTLLALTIHSLTVAACRRFLTTPPNPVMQRRYRTLFTLLDLLFGTSWVLNINVLVDLGLHGAGDFSLFAMLLVVAIFSMLAASVPSAVYAATLPVASVVAAHYFLRGQPQDLVLAAMTIGAEVYFILVAKRLYLVVRLCPRGTRPVRHAGRRTRTGESEIRRSRASRRSRQSCEVALPSADEPRVAHAPQCGARFLGSDEERNSRPALSADIQRVCRRHPCVRRAPPPSHQ